MELLPVLLGTWFFLPGLVFGATCTPPVGCAYCTQWDYHGDKTLFEASCNYPPLTNIPTTFPSTLGKLHASHNRITNLTKTSIASYPYLKWLNLEYNFMRFIENGTFMRQALLSELYIGYNSLQSVTAGTFVGLRDLQRLRLTRNFISHLHKGVFDGLHLLTVLEIADNKVATIEEGAFEGLGNLKTLFFGGNLVKTLSASTFGSLPALTMVDLSFNAIEEIKEGSFLELPNLSTLHVNDCKLRKIPRREPFKGLRKLTELDLSKNPLYFIPADTFSDATNLESLNMTNTNISVIHNGTFNGLGSLRTLSISGNPFLCDCSLKWMRDWIASANRSGLNLEFASSTKCSFPSRHSGRRFDQVNQSEFQCTCTSCRENAACVDIGPGSGNNSCACTADWKGGNCNAVCNVTQRDKTCTSVGGLCYCSYPVQKNTTIVCHKNAVLLNISNTWECRCMKGFTGNGSFCVDIDECSESAVCHSQADCKNFQGFYECICKTGYEGDGKECYPALSQPTNIKVTHINSTAVTITWFVNTTAESKACMLMFKKIGDVSWNEKTMDLHLSNRTVLGSLTPDTTYLLKIMLLSKHNSRSPVSEITEFKTGDNADGGGGGQVKGAGGGGGSSSTLTASVSTVGALVVVGIIALVAYLLWRDRKAKQRASMLAVNVEISLDDIQSQGMDGAHVNTAITQADLPAPRLAADKWEIPRDKIVMGDKLGEGEFGVVLEGELLTGETPQKVAIKMLKDYADRMDYKDMLRELDMFKGVGQHENVVSLLGACTIGIPLYIITEYIAGGTLLELLRDSRCIKTAYVNANLVSRLSGKDLLKLALDVAKGMRHIADNRFVHRDLAARNVLVTKNMVAKITDFGLARDIYSDGIYLNAKGGKLPLKWMAPESLLDYVYTCHSDVWSYGVLMWEIWSFGAMPYHAVLPNEILSKLMSGYRLESPPNCPPEIYDVIKSCWNAEPELRPTFIKLCTILEELHEETPRVLTVQMNKS